MLETGNDRVIQRGAPLGRGHLKRRFELIRVGCEWAIRRQAKSNLVVERDDEQLVVRTPRSRERRDRPNERQQLRTHALTVIDDETERNRRVAVMKHRHRLRSAVLENSKIFGGETGDGVTLRISHANGQRDDACSPR